MNVSVVLVRGLAGYLQRRGVPPERFRERAGLTAEKLGSPSCMLTRLEYQNAAIAARELSRDPAMALRAGREAPVRFLGLLGNLMANCESMGDALTNYIRFASLIAPESLWAIEEDGDHVRLLHDEPSAARGASRLACEMTVSISMGFAEFFMGPYVRAVEVRLAYPAPSHARDYYEVCRCPVVFDADRNEIVFERRALEARRFDADEASRHALLEQAESLLQDGRVGSSIVGRVRALLRQQDCLREVDCAYLAPRIGMSPRALARRLSMDDTRLTDLIGAAKRDLACRRLRDPECNIKELADELGFSEPSGFYRAFRRWTGATPTAYRTAQTAQYSFTGQMRTGACRPTAAHPRLRDRAPRPPIDPDIDVLVAAD